MTSNYEQSSGNCMVDPTITTYATWYPFRALPRLEAKATDIRKKLKSDLPVYDIKKSPYIPPRFYTPHIICDFLRSKKLQISNKV